jgi:SAM-dependent methyltransferase
MLRAAALLQLDLGLRALDEGMTLKDSSAYNVQFAGSRPTFIDVGSFERLQPDEPWSGYRQFCMLFLYPLMLQAYRRVSFRPLLRGSIDGIEPQQAARLFTMRDRLRRGVLTHVALHARLERRNQARSGGEVREEIKRAKFNPELVKANMRRLQKVVTRLEWEGSETAWSGYRDDNSYSDDDTREKEHFVREALSGRKHRLVWDLGCNDGTFSRIAADFADVVVACDSDEAVVDALYRSLPADQGTILPLVVDLVDSSPSLGWRGRERRRLEERGRPDTILALALVHHLSITGNVPLDEILDWFRDLGGRLVIEFPDRTDPMTQGLLAGKAQGSNADYGRENFERLLASRFAIEKSHSLHSGTRFLYVARPK